MENFSRQFKQAIQEFLKREKRLNLEIEELQRATLIENDSEIARLSLRVDLMEKEIIKEVKTNAVCFKMREIDFISATIYYEDQKLTLSNV